MKSQLHCPDIQVGRDSMNVMHDVQKLGKIDAKRLKINNADFPPRFNIH